MAFSANEWHARPLWLGTEPAGGPHGPAYVHRHRGQGPDGLGGASRDDDGRMLRGTQVSKSVFYRRVELDRFLDRLTNENPR